MTEDYVLNNLENKIVEIYKNINLGKNEICVKCKNKNNKLNNPVGMWLIGANWEKNKTKVLFVGKNARGDGDNDIKNTFLETRDWLFNSGFAFWSYTKEISKRIFNDKSCENISVTNMVKCNDSLTKDTTTEYMKNFCINELKIIRKEIEIIKPTHIVFYTDYKYDNYIFDEKGLFDSIKKIPEQQSQEDFYRKVGKKKMLYREAFAKIKDIGINVLRLGHPERKKKEAFINLVVNWINKTK